MKLLAAVLLVCLLVTGTASAVSMNPGSVGGAKAGVTVSTPQITKVSSGLVPVTIVTQQGHGMLEVYSDPSGATVIVTGYSSAPGTTPAKFSLPEGTYTVTVSLAGYKSHTETFHLDAGAIKQIDADLMRLISASSAGNIAKASIETTKPSITRPTITGPGAAVTLDYKPLEGGSPPVQMFLESTPANADVVADHQNVGKTPIQLSFAPGQHSLDLYFSGYYPNMNLFNVKAGDADIHWSLTLYALNATNATACPDESWVCLTQAEAGQQFGSAYTMYSQNPCGYTAVNNQTCYNATNCARYCVKASETTPSGGGTENGAGTGNTPGTANAAPATPLQPFFDFFNSLLGRKAPDGSRGDWVMFNPCPEPPGLPVAPADSQK